MRVHAKGTRKGSPSSVCRTRAGVAVLVGRSNVGKSTLLNALVGTKIAIVTPKPQTTRMPVRGIVTTERPGFGAQIVFVDTPGVLERSNDRLTKAMIGSIRDSLEGVDVLVHVVDPTRAVGDEERRALALVEPVVSPKILVINKIDVSGSRHLDSFRALSSRYDGTVEVSALRGTNLTALLDSIIGHLPEGEFLYPEHQVTDIPAKLWTAEIIREKLFFQLRQELPYHTHVEVTEFAERENGVLYIAASILTENERYQRMIIGKKGAGVKDIGKASRKEIEAARDQRVFLDLSVLVDPRWTERLTQII
jgi:GTP-binding protein Era